MRCSTTIAGTVYSDFAIEKANQPATTNISVDKLYDGLLKVKAKKVKDLKGLVAKYVPLSDQWYYKQIILDEIVTATGEQDVKTDSGSDLSDED